MNIDENDLVSDNYYLLDIELPNAINKGYYFVSGKLSYKGFKSVAYIKVCNSPVKYRSVLILETGCFSELTYFDDSFSKIYFFVSRDDHYDLDVKINSIMLKPVSRFIRYLYYSYVSVVASISLPKPLCRHLNINLINSYLKPKLTFNNYNKYRLKHGSVDYQRWLNTNENISVIEERRIVKFSELLKHHSIIHFIVIVDVRQSSIWSVKLTLESLNHSIYKPDQIWLLCSDCDDSKKFKNLSSFHNFLVLPERELTSSINQLVNLSYFLWMPASCIIFPHSITWFVYTISENINLTCIYSDHDFREPGGIRHSPHFKPDWSEELALSSGYTGNVICTNKKSLLDCLSNTVDVTPYLLLLHSAVGRLTQVAHIPAILWQESDHNPMSKSLDSEYLVAYLAKQDREVRVNKDEQTGYLRIIDNLPKTSPLISIIIPTRDRLDLIKPCVESILNSTTYPNYEILILDNQSKDPNALMFLENISNDNRVNVIPFDHSFNYAAMNNYGAHLAKGSLICFLNNDTEVLTSDWLLEMVRCFSLNKVGVVGAQLRYPDGRLQHAGDLIGGGGSATHLHGKLPAESHGYMNRVSLTQDLSAVTAACMLTTKELFLSLGGMNQKKLKIAFNDVDYCLRVREAGFRVIYTPYAKLIHYESESRGADISTKKIRQSFREAQYMRKRWSHLMMNDPFYNPNLNYSRADFSLDSIPFIKKPWEM